MLQPSRATSASRPPARADAAGAGAAVAALAVFVAAQVAALALAAWRVPLSARYPAPAERCAVEVLLVAQYAAATLLSPVLLRDRRTAALAIASTWPMLRLAAALASAPVGGVLAEATLLAAWLVALSACAAAARGSRAANVIVVAVASAFVLATPVMRYCGAEFNGEPPAALRALYAASPLSHLTGGGRQPLSLAVWVVPACVIAAAAVLVVIRQSGPRPPAQLDAPSGGQRPPDQRMV